MMSLKVVEGDVVSMYFPESFRILVQCLGYIAGFRRFEISGRSVCISLTFFWSFLCWNLPLTTSLGILLIYNPRFLLTSVRVSMGIDYQGNFSQ
jgi:hypothetical protein